MGHVISADGIKPDPVKVSAVVNMSSPQNKEELRSFLGLVNYLGKFIPNLADLTVPLCWLLKKDNDWISDYPQMQAYDKLKSEITNAPVLKYFDPELPTRGTCDASSYGPGAVLEQFNSKNWCRIANASRSLTSSEENYCQLEKECLSISFSCEKFHFSVENYHSPLKSIFSRPLVKAPQRF